MPGRSSTAFQYRFAGEDLLLIQAILRRPAAREVAEAVVGAAREVPACSCGLFDGEWLLCAVRDDRGTTQYASGFINGIVQVYEDVARDVLKDNNEAVLAGCLSRRSGEPDRDCRRKT